MRGHLAVGILLVLLGTVILAWTLALPSYALTELSEAEMAAIKAGWCQCVGSGNCGVSGCNCGGATVACSDPGTGTGCDRYGCACTGRRCKNYPSGGVGCTAKQCNLDGCRGSGCANGCKCGLYCSNGSPPCGGTARWCSESYPCTQINGYCDGSSGNGSCDSGCCAGLTGCGCYWPYPPGICHCSVGLCYCP